MSEKVATTLAVPLWAWSILAAAVLISLVTDLLAHRGARETGRKWAILWSVAWVSLALAFGGWIAIQFGRGAAQEYFTAYLIEKSLSVDNLFVFLIIFSRLKIPETEQHRVLQWGIFGAFVTRAAFIASGTAILSKWHWVIYVLGAFLLYTGFKTFAQHAADSSEGKVLPFLRRRLPMTSRLHGHKFIALENGRRVATPLLLALLVIEVSDVLFAIDSIPAVFAISVDPFIVYSSNVFAILGMRALYLVLVDLLRDLKYLHYGLGAILCFAGAKMLTSKLFHIPHAISLLIIIAILVAAIVPSVLVRRRKARAALKARQTRGAAGTYMRSAPPRQEL